MAIQFACPQCAQQIAVPDAMAGMRGKCPGCAQVVVIPGTSQSVETGATPASSVSAAPDDKACPMCGERIKAAAIKCRHCGEMLGQAGGASDRARARGVPSGRGAAGREMTGAAESWAHGPPTVSEREWLVAFLLCFFLGGFGIHRFYTGHIAIGIVQLLTLGGCGIWALIDLILIATGSYTDAEGLALKR